ncbi:hypothetical protein COLO4_37194 [Corchorus olitorius]|uniref:Uncharacterized protein n=1 Tax=Corchorus olitorius TaxID=93759 RepID=A0A1R3G345_9ROSI|nr:hypothetical protein COLO4_37194 [Corchorus olitorius]
MHQITMMISDNNSHTTLQGLAAKCTITIHLVPTRLREVFSTTTFEKTSPIDAHTDWKINCNTENVDLVHQIAIETFDYTSPIHAETGFSKTRAIHIELRLLQFTTTQNALRISLN